MSPVMNAALPGATTRKTILIRAAAAAAVQAPGGAGGLDPRHAMAALQRPAHVAWLLLAPAARQRSSVSSANVSSPSVGVGASQLKAIVMHLEKTGIEAHIVQDLHLKLVHLVDSGVVRQWNRQPHVASGVLCG